MIEQQVDSKWILGSTLQRISVAIKLFAEVLKTQGSLCVIRFPDVLLIYPNLTRSAEHDLTDTAHMPTIRVSFVVRV